MRGNSGLVPMSPLGNVPSDEGKRAADIVTTHLLADRGGNVRRWVALRLSDGGSDGAVYDSVGDAANAQLHYRQCAYVPIPPDGMSPREADVILHYHRRVYDSGNLPPYLAGVPLAIPNHVEDLL